MQQAWDKPEHAKGDVDHGVGGADTAFDPDLKGVSDLRRKVKVDGCLPAMGGKRMAISPRNMSPEHMMLGGWLISKAGAFWRHKLMAIAL